ncbi:PAS domain S-box protein [Tsuneonella sp. CC-YZS046]|uniref:PAS domain S-box protein n=1 Tax=Tsuneonella sp. CC-YZS046 TaxID=3042152 RepID=UPI002D79D623|nr:PAS domain S-box protein [Tsuneonella sp. CC-YZS046]WRO66047.1 PAS domain S-box protein [Tsuneonella sp. CC-YZS046]
MSPASLHSLSDPHFSADMAAWLAAIVEDTTDAILSKTLDGTITSWNAGAERLFGYSREEAVGRPISLIIPEERLHEEADIVARLRLGERIGRFETVRCTREAVPVHVEVTISPLRDPNGTIIGASTIARDISDRLRHADEQALLLSEMRHRVKNLLSIVQGLVSIGSRRADDIQTFIEQLNARITSLAAAQALVLHSEDRAEGACTTLGEILTAVMAPYRDAGIALTDCDAVVGQHAMTSLALLFHELATNAVKYGALSNPEGSLNVSIATDAVTVSIFWREAGGQRSESPQAGFGTSLLDATLRGLQGTIVQEWRDGAFETVLKLPRDALAR